ncbi:response regulator [Duganella sp. FT50W]|uniref:Chemotaxis protein CheA n=2 Tax=Duganella lactea TaxID=2692173 RepID=A0A6L8MKJ6_9BURK|nr:response regulator [Duganella lactea]
MVEIRESLARSRTALFEAGGREPEDQATQLQHAKSHLHQAHGALQMVDLEGVSLMTEVAEAALDRFKAGTLKCSTDNAQAVAQLYQALVEYLEELLAGAPSQPARLFPYYRAVQQMMGAERVHPADLFFPDLSQPAGLPPAPDSPSAPDYAACRQRFERALLPYLKSADPAQQQEHAAALLEAVTRVAEAQREPRARAFWLAMQGFAELVAGGQLTASLYVKQLFGMINLQIRRLSQGTAAQPESMLRDALFFIATAGADSAAEVVVNLRQAYVLDGLAPADYETRRYGQIDTEALEAAKVAVAQARTSLDSLAHAEFDAALSDGAALCEKLNLPALATLMHQLAEVSRTAVAVGRGEELSREMDTALLFAEHGLRHIRHLPDDFAANADTIGARLVALAAGETPPQPAQWQMQQEDAAVALALEMKAGLRQVERGLDAYYGDPSLRPALKELEPVLHQLQGALSALDQTDAANAVRHVQASVQALANGDGDSASESKVLDDIAQNVSALGFFVDMLAQNTAGARERFAFDAEQGSFRSVPFKKIAESGAIPLLEDEVPVPVPAAMPVEAPPPAASDALVEQELLDVFIAEAREVLAFVGETLPQPRSEENLTMLRRSFHTLKGSGRMVGLNQFADAAHAIEKVLNVWLAEQRPVTDALFDLLNSAMQEMNAWVAELVANGVLSCDADALIDAAARVQEGGEPESEPAPAAAPQGKVIDFPSITPMVPRDDNVKHVGGLEIPLPLFNIYLHESDDLVRKLVTDFGEWRHEPRRPVNPDALAAAHTLAGTSGTVGFKGLRELALALESTLEALLPPAPHLDQVQHDLLDFAMERMRQMLQSFAAGDLPDAQPELINALRGLREELAATPAAASNEIESRLDNLVAETMDGLNAPAVAEESALDALFRDTYNAISGTVPESEAPQAPPKKKRQEVHMDDGVDDLFNAAFDDAFAEPPLKIAEPETAVPPPAPEAMLFNAAFDDAFAEPPLKIAEPETAVPPPAPEAMPAPEVLPAMPPVFHDELDPDLLPVFLEEGADLLPQVGEALRAWQHTPADVGQAQSLLRLLHTVKGSARMAGAMHLGQHCHEIETHIENMVQTGAMSHQSFEELLAHYDHALLLFEQLQTASIDQEALAGLADNVDTLADASSHTAPPVADEQQAGARSPLVRVRADILDRLVNQAGEVSISRSKLENEIDTLRTSLADFADNVARLRRQLREVEMQAESQIASRMAVSSEREFDPLEFDRFTRLQELTRMMAESVSDVASFHESLTRGVDNAHNDLAQQARLTRELQRDLMRVRMVPFASISERLFRVARQSAKDVDKRVNLDIRGGSVELDRSVLERMSAPFEHLLRNAIAHGVESREARATAGKNETGELLVQVAQQGNEVVIEFSDDGGGLDLARIKAKAISSGLLLEDDMATDAQIADLIFEPGFSTADTLTELSGRGVGMDVVQSEAQALGGRVDMFSEPGKGTRFTIRLPLTLAVTQVVLLAAGGKTYALPAILVEQVVQLKDDALDEARDNGMQYLPALLGDAAQPPTQRSTPVMMLKNGNERLALQVDEVLGNREVVIKNIGPQLARMVGIAGATVLGTGDIVLILNPVALAQHLAHHPELKEHYAQVAEDSPPMLPALGHTIMVVDDSLTVRRVTQRLLEREGYRVLLAKDGVDALEQLQNTPPDLMLVDIEMPRMDGFDLTRNVRGGERTRDIPIIMITSRSADKHRNVALELGVNAYFGKPYQEVALLEAIEGLLTPRAS